MKIPSTTIIQSPPSKIITTTENQPKIQWKIKLDKPKIGRKSTQTKTNHQLKTHNPNPKSKSNINLELLQRERERERQRERAFFRFAIKKS